MQTPPQWVTTLLENRWTWLFSRVALTSAFWISGLTKLFNFPDALAEQRHFGLHPAAAYAAATILVQLVGSLLVILDRWTWLGSGALGVFTVAATLIAHAFWTMEGSQRVAAMNTFFEHLGLIAGLILAALVACRRQGSPPWA